jgi:type I restriction enzyme R subunit
MNFIDTLINFITINGTIDKAMLFGRPFTGINQNGVVGVLIDKDTGKILDIIERLNGNFGAALLSHWN